ncbi:hypothetical protein [Pseudobutyrivibrio sp.]
MNVINKFLIGSVDDATSDVSISVNENDAQLINNMFASFNKSRPNLMILPKFRRNQIWTVRNQYVDFEGELQRSKHKTMVLLITEPEELSEDVSFVRVCPLSPFIDMASSNDVLCNDAALVGFPFIVETWNEQPMLTEILEKYVGDYNCEILESDEILSKDQQTFREIEISNARFLNRSIIAYTNEMERAEKFSFSVDFVSDSKVRTIRMPKLNVQSPTLIPLTGHSEYAMAARSGNMLTDNDCIEIDSVDVPFHIEVRKKNNEYILTIIPKVDVKLSSNGKTLDSRSNDERIVFSGLKQGLYDIESPITTKKITIRLK